MKCKICNIIMILFPWQIFHNLQPLNVCMSYQGTLIIVEKISEDHDKDVQFWADKMKEKIEERRVRERVDIITCIIFIRVCLIKIHDN